MRGCLGGVSSSFFPMGSYFFFHLIPDGNVLIVPLDTFFSLFSSCIVLFVSVAAIYRCITFVFSCFSSELFALHSFITSCYDDFVHIS